jgi:hypothetical protein
MARAVIDATKGLLIDSQSGPTGQVSPLTGTSSQLAAGDGSAVSVGSGMTLAGGTLSASGGGPQTVFEVDFADLPNTTYTNGQAITIVGSTGSATFNVTIDDSFGSGVTVEIVNGVGLRFTTGFIGSFRFQTSLKRLGATSTLKDVTVWLNVPSSTTGGSSNAGQVFLYNSTTWIGFAIPGSSAANVTKTDSGGTNGAIWNPDGSGTGRQLVYSDRTLITQIMASGRINLFGGNGTYATWPDSSQIRLIGRNRPEESDLASTPYDFAERVFAIVGQAQVSGGYTCVFRRMRVQVG